ncbi:MAG: DUF1801 domain-containing protein [Candidatus Saccharimonadales bacterium]
MKTHTQVDDYINSFEGMTRDRLNKIRSIVHEIAPQATEDFAYKMPAYKINGKPLVYFAGYAHHIGLYATPNGHVAFTKEFSRYKQGKGSVQFPHTEQLPEVLIADVIRYRMSNILSN